MYNYPSCRLSSVGICNPPPPPPPPPHTHTHTHTHTHHTHTHHTHTHKNYNNGWLFVRNITILQITASKCPTKSCVSLFFWKGYALILTEIHWIFKLTFANFMTTLRTISTSYNCHSYAWCDEKFIIFVQSILPFYYFHRYCRMTGPVKTIHHRK